MTDSTTTTAPAFDPAYARLTDAQGRVFQVLKDVTAPDGTVIGKDWDQAATEAAYKAANP